MYQFKKVKLLSLIGGFFALSLSSFSQVTLTSSDLPLVIITTPGGERIHDSYKITATMKIISNGAEKRNFPADSGNIYSGPVGIEIRGAYSASLPQKPYSFETRDSAGNNNNVSILDMPFENDWVLLANYNDKSFLRNVLAFDIFKKMGHYAPGMRFCELVLNGEYEGIYLMGEKIKQDKGRVSISSLKPKDTSGDKLTGGYIFKNDYYSDADSWKSSFSAFNKPGSEVHFVYHDPQPTDLTPEQKAYIRDYINTFETVLYNPSFNAQVFGYKAYIDIDSFIDYFILSEVTRNVDAYKKSRFYYKDKESIDGRIHSGPPWDYDWAMKNLLENCKHFNQRDGSGWAYLINECDAYPRPPSWEVRMLQDPEFSRKLSDRYYDLRSNILSINSIQEVIDSVASLLNEAQTRHFVRWPILGINVGTPEPDFQPLTYYAETVKLRDWLDTRLRWLDTRMAGFDVGFNEPESDKISCRIFPNPFSEYIRIESDREITGLTITGLTGIKVIERKETCILSEKLDLRNLPKGLYLITLEFSGGKHFVSKIIKN